MSDTDPETLLRCSLINSAPNDLLFIEFENIFDDFGLETRVCSQKSEIFLQIFSCSLQLIKFEFKSESKHEQDG